MSDEAWGPWIEHDGKGCPCVGSLVYVLLGKDGHLDPRIDDGPWELGWRGITRDEGIGIAEDDDAWNGVCGSYPIIWFRIRKPRGLTILENLIADLPAPVRPKVTV